MDKREIVFVFEKNAPSELCQLLSSHKWQLHSANNMSEAKILFDKHQFLVGLALIEENSSPKFLSALENIFSISTGTKWILLISQKKHEIFSLTAHQKQLIRNYGYDYHTIPLLNEKLLFTLGHAYGMAEITINPYDNLLDSHSQYNIVGHSPAMLKVFDQIKKISQTDQPILIEGETGTGKHLIAKAIHEVSSRAERPFVDFNCGEYNENQIISELFGCEKRGSPKVRQSKKGFIETVQGGSLFLDYINEFPLSKQPFLLKFLENQTFKRLGGIENIKTDVRLIASSHTNLTDAVIHHQFRQDLFFRLRVLRISIPPLRDREDDIELLAWHFFNKLNTKNNHITKGFSIDALNVLHTYDWPGNVRELQNCIQHAITVSTNRLITPKDLGLERRGHKRKLKTLEEYRAHADREAALSALKCSHYNISKAAKLLNISRVTLYGLIEKHQLKDLIPTN